MLPDPTFVRLIAAPVAAPLEFLIRRNNFHMSIARYNDLSPSG